MITGTTVKSTNPAKNGTVNEAPLRATVRRQRAPEERTSRPRSAGGVVNGFGFRSRDIRPPRIRSSVSARDVDALGLQVVDGELLHVLEELAEGDLLGDGLGPLVLQFLEDP